MDILRRVITYFYKNSEDEEVVGEIPLPQDLDLGELQKLFGVESGNPMYDCYPIGENEVAFFKSKFGIKLTW